MLPGMLHPTGSEAGGGSQGEVAAPAPARQGGEPPQHGGQALAPPVSLPVSDQQPETVVAGSELPHMQHGHVAPPQPAMQPAVQPEEQLPASTVQPRTADAQLTLQQQQQWWMSLSHAQRAAMMLAAEQQGTQEQQPQKQQQQQRQQQQQQGRLPVARPLAQRQRVTFATGAAAVASGRCTMATSTIPPLRCHGVQHLLELRISPGLLLLVYNC
jgi:hypothetical protein